MHASRRVSRTACDAYCRWLLHFTVSLHIGARNLPSLERAAEVMVWTAASLDRAHRTMAATRNISTLLTW